MTYQPPNILLVEDDENDVFLMERALAKAKVGVPMQLVSNGEDALRYLKGEGKYADRAHYPLPELVFLDLKLPFVHGFEVLEWIRQQSGRPDLNVVILTSSPEERDRKRAAALGAMAYCVKPPTEQLLLDLFRSIPAFAALTT
jgi:CheY-like chemotaxis protein